LISNRAILFDIFDIKECHKNLTVCRLPTILLYRIPKIRRRARASALRVENQKEEQLRKRVRRGELVSLFSLKNDSLITEEKNF